MPIVFAPERPLNDLSRTVGKLFEQMQKGYSTFAPGESWTPPVNLYETDVCYLVCVDLAGVEKEKIDVAVDGNILRIQGNRNVPGYDGEPGMKQARIHLLEIDYGAFTREVELPVDVRHDHIHAEYVNGLLWIKLPKDS